jgi:hypothetical protein
MPARPLDPDDQTAILSLKLPARLADRVRKEADRRSTTLPALLRGLIERELAAEARPAEAELQISHLDREMSDGYDYFSHFSDRLSSDDEADAAAAAEVIALDLYFAVEEPLLLQLVGNAMLDLFDSVAEAFQVTEARRAYRRHRLRPGHRQHRPPQ